MATECPAPAPDGILSAVWAFTERHGPAWGLVLLLVLGLGWTVHYALKREREWSARLEDEVDRLRGEGVQLDPEVEHGVRERRSRRC